MASVVQWCSILFLPYCNIIIPIIISYGAKSQRILKPYSTSPYLPSSLHLEESCFEGVRENFQQDSLLHHFCNKTLPTFGGFINMEAGLVYEPSISFKWIWVRNVCIQSATCLCGLSLYQKLLFLPSNGIQNEPTITIESPLSFLLQSWILHSCIGYVLMFSVRNDHSFLLRAFFTLQAGQHIGKARGRGSCGDLTQRVSRGFHYKFISVCLETLARLPLGV